jgi:hypothetical protein
MNKTIKKSILLILILTLTFALFSCADNTKEKQNANPEQTENNTESTDEAIKLTDGLPDTDMQGYVFNIFNFDDTWYTWRNNTVLSEEQDGDIVNDAMYMRQRQLEDRFNCKFKTNEVADTTEYIKKNVTSGDNTYQIYNIYDQNFGVLVPYITDCNLLPYLRLTEKHWNPNATCIYNFADKQLALAGNVSLSVVNGASCLVLTKTYIKNIMPARIYILLRAIINGR